MRLLALLLLLPGCQSCGKKATEGAAPAASVSAAASARPAVSVGVLGAVRFEPDTTIRAGIPKGCVLSERAQSARVGPPAPLFFAPDEPRDELVIGLPGEKPRAGVVPLGGAAPRGLPGFDPEHPSALAAGEKGWLQFQVPPTGSGRAVLMREGSAPELAAEGEGMEAIDLRCRGGHCAALSTRAMRVAAAGATVLLGRAGEPVKAWKRSDYVPERAAPERPFVVAAVSEGKATATTVSEEGVRFFEAEGPEARVGAFLPAPFGALDALVLKRPVVIAHGAKLSGDCARPRPMLTVAREGAPAVEFPVDAPPLSLFARPLTRGAFVAWLVPTYCGDQQRRIAYVALLDDEGGLRAGPMAVTEATGLAVATSGERVDLWLRRGERVAWLKLRCE